jgi:hypothetical protein
MTRFCRGAIPSPRHRLAAASPHIMSDTTPESLLYVPETLNMWLNDVDGDCVTAEEAFAKACYRPEIFITPAEVSGFLQDEHAYDDGPHVSVDWTNAVILRNAIYHGPVKIGVSADQLENAVVGNPPPNGWVATGFTEDSNEDHCVSLCGYGTFAWMAKQLGTELPSGVDSSTQGYGLFTWGSIGMIDIPSMLAITQEAWLRTPTTIIRSAK